MRFFVYSTLLYFRVVFALRPHAPLFFFGMCGNEMPGNGIFGSRKGGFELDKKLEGRTSLWFVMSSLPDLLATHMLRSLDTKIVGFSHQLSTQLRP